MDPSVRRAHSEDRRAQQALYEKEGYIGEGAFGVVMKAVLKQPTVIGAAATANEASSSSSAVAASSSSAAAAAASKKQYVAIKQMMNSREGQGIPQDAYREIKILKELRHENIVSLDRIFTRPDKHEVDLVYEYGDHDLAEIIKVNRGKLQSQIHPDPRFVKSVLQQILTGLAFLHKSWCMHRDMKPANILVTGLSQGDEEGGRVKIADFGLARIFQSPLRKLSDDGEVVTIWYRAPELLLGAKHYTRAIDIFAVGCIFYELLTCTPLFPGNEIKGQKVFQENQVKEVFRLMGKPTLEQWKGMADCPHYAQIKSWPQKDLLLGMLAYDPSLRLTADAALQHPYFREEPKPDRNVFRDVHGGWLQYPQKPAKPINAGKRGREHEHAAAAAAQAHAQAQALQASQSAAASAAASAQAIAAYASVHHLPPPHAAMHPPPQPHYHPPYAHAAHPHAAQPAQPGGVGSFVPGELPSLPLGHSQAAMQQRFHQLASNQYPFEAEAQELMQPNKMRRTMG